MNMRSINYAKGPRRLKRRVKNIAVKKADHPSMDDLRPVYGHPELFRHKKTNETFKIKESGRVYRVAVEFNY